MEEIKLTVVQLLKRAREKLESARILLDAKRFDDAISRAYYAAFYAARALLLLLGVQVRTHEGLLSMFGLKVVKQGLLPREIGKYLTELHDARVNSDYAIVVYFDREDAEEYVRKASEVVKAIERVIAEKFGIAVS